MTPTGIRHWLCWAGIALLLGALCQPACAQLTRGFAVELKPSVTGDEVASQDGLWELQVQFKPMRMLWVEVTDKESGQLQKKLVWYLVYRVQNVPSDRPADTSDTEPINVEDPLPGKPMFVPEFTLLTTETGLEQILPDVIIPEAQAAIERRERQQLNNNVDIVGPIPPARVPDGSDEGVYYGVAMWSDVDPQADRFVVYISGFSSAYQIRDGADGEPLVWRKVISQEYLRPGDRFDANEVEIRRVGDPKWLYRPEEPGDEELLGGESTGE